MTNHRRDIIVIGASAGGVAALCTLTAHLPPDLPAAVFIVMHIAAWQESSLPQILSRCSPLPVVQPKTGAAIERGRIYVAPPNQHLLIDSADQIQLWHGPKENNCRPSINALFRSAAVTYGARVTGVILTGSLDDGATGLWWIKRMGGVAVVQNPNQAEFAQMPQAALSYVRADYVVSIVEIGAILAQLARGLPETAERGDEGRSQ